ncbi:MAG: 4Fe-4S dicluster domain-containing protein, partial [Dehalococcoidia bacterium]
PVPVEGVSEMMRRNFDSPYWDRVADRCIHCNICSYVCPCCYCFDIRDYTGKDKIDRVRSWESCQSAGFTRIAGGHDPRPTKGARLRQRWYHKLLYYPTLFGDIKCTGCGRCVRSCPVNIDIREIITDVQKLNV